MDPVALAVIVREACVTGPVGAGCGFVGVCGLLVVELVDPLHPAQNDVAANATVPCMIWRRVSAEYSGSELMIALQAFSIPPCI